MRVLKIGGTSIGETRNWITILNQLNNQSPSILVLSAFAGVTNLLIDFSESKKTNDIIKCKKIIKTIKGIYDYNIDQCLQSHDNIFKAKCFFNSIVNDIQSSRPEINNNFIITRGEYLSCYVFHLYALEQGDNNIIIDAADYIITNETGEPELDIIYRKSDELIDIIVENKLVVTQGFVSKNSMGEISTLNRGGSDYTATIIGATINADKVEIWSDIDGIHNNDPRYVNKTKSISHLSYDEAAEMAYFGAKVLHPTCIIPTRDKGIPVHLKDTANPNAIGTIISDKTIDKSIKAIAAKDNITVIKIKSYRMLMAFGFLKKVFDVFDYYKTSIDMITTSEISISLTIDNIDNLSNIKDELEKLGSIEIEYNQSIICVIGSFIATDGFVLDKIFGTLTDIPIRMISYGGSKHNVSILIPTENKILALNILQSTLQNSHYVNS